MKNPIGLVPFQSVVLKFLFDRGYFSLHSLLEACVNENIIKKNGSMYEINAGKKTGIITLDESDLDEDILDYPKLENALSNVYQKHMRR